LGRASKAAVAATHKTCPPTIKEKCHREKMMTHETINGKPVHSAAKMYAEEFKAGLLDRREFLTRASALGVATSAIYTMGGLTQPAHAAAHAKQGGTIRMQMEVRALKDPRTWDCRKRLA
jgi:peptide/nickel transport system substrate-binding protein